MSIPTPLKRWRQWPWLEIMAVVGLLVLAATVRFWQLTELMTFTYDQGRDMYVWLNLSRGDLTLIGPTTGLAGFFLGPFFYYALWPGFVLTQGSPFGVVGWQIMLAVLTLPFAYWWLRPKTGGWLALWAVLLLALTPGAINQARTIWNPSLMVPVLLPMIWALWQSRYQQFWLPVAALLFGLALQTEFAYVVFLLPVIGIWLAVHSPVTTLVRRRWPSLGLPTFHYSWRWLGIAALVGALTFAPQGLFELRHDFLMTNSLLRELQDPSKQGSLSKIWQERPILIMMELQNSLFGNGPGSRWTLWVVIGLMITLTWQRRKDAREWLVVGLFWAPLIGLMFHRGNYGYFFNYYVTAHYYVVILGLALALQRWQHQAKVTLMALLALLWLAHFWSYAQVVLKPGVLEYTVGHQLRALRHIRATKTEPLVGLTVMVPNQLPINYQYLNEWLGQQGEGGVNFEVTDAYQEYFMLYEPPDSSHEITFDPWYKGYTEQGHCSDKTSFGILTVEHCRR